MKKRTLSFVAVVSLLFAQHTFASTAVNSLNWAGFVSSQGTYTSVSATWTVPTITPATSFVADSAWIGIGGMVSSDLIQTGTQESSSNGQVTYQAWYELIPESATSIPITIHAGDMVSASLNMIGPSLWQLHFKNEATGQTFDKTIQYVSTQASAEWIEEMPRMDSGYVPLADFGQVNFSNVKTIMNGVTKTLLDTAPYKVNIASNGALVASPSNMGSDGASFSVSKFNANVSAPVAPLVRVPAASLSTRTFTISIAPSELRRTLRAARVRRLANMLHNN